MAIVDIIEGETKEAERLVRKRLVACSYWCLDAYANHSLSIFRIFLNCIQFLLWSSVTTFGLRGESKYEFRTVSVQWTLREWGGSGGG